MHRRPVVVALQRDADGVSFRHAALKSELFGDPGEIHLNRPQTLVQNPNHLIHLLARNH